MRFIVIILLLPAYFAAGQSFPNEVWHEGQAVLVKGDTLKGLIKYNLDTDLVQHKFDQASTINTITARSLAFFEIFDNTSNRYRQFYVLPYSVKRDYKAPIIFELILEGPELTLLSREKVEYQVTSYPYAVSGTYTRLVLVYTHYFLAPDGHIELHTGKKRDLLWIMKRKSADMKRFVKANKIKPDRRTDLVKTVNYYNSLFENPETKAN